MMTLIRNENERDCRLVEELTREAFWNLYVPGCDEHYLTHVLRKHSDYIPELSFVAIAEDSIVGNIMYSKSSVVEQSDSGNKIKTLTFGPVCVHPDYQNKGIGSKLIRHTINLAKESGYKAIIILGYPKNYCKYGFKNCKDLNITDTEGKFPYGMLVLELGKDIFKGKKWIAHFSDVFNLDPDSANEFDKQFKHKEKEYKPSQEEFSIAVRAYLD